MKQLQLWFTSKYSPLQQLLVIGLFVRLFSVIFSKGFGWHDDHFLIIESAASWADGEDYNDWLPNAKDPNRTAMGHPLLYTGFHYYLFVFFKSIGLNNPQTKMLFIRLIHALWSLLIIKYGYLLALKYGNKKTAWYAGIFLALFWFMPFMSVRNLVEFVCVPPLLMAIYLLSNTKAATRDYLLAGLWMGIAVSMRFQTVFMLAGIGIALLIAKTTIKQLVLIFIAFAITTFLGTGLIDLIIWKKPFAEFMAYVDYNLQNSTAYGYNNTFMYLELLLGLLIPPLSFVLLAGYFYTWKKIPFLFWPAFLYLAFHTYFPNKQERFIMTALPLVVISGTVGMFQLHERYHSKIKPRLFAFSKWFVIVINLILLPVLTVSYSKRHRVESMTYLYNKHDSVNFLVEDSNKENDFLLPPRFYYGHWGSTIGISKTYTPKLAREYYDTQKPAERPKYIVFWQAENINTRVDSVKVYFPKLTYETTIDASLIDKTLHWLNPLNDNQTSFIYTLE